MEKVQQIGLYMGQLFYDFTYCKNEDDKKEVLSKPPKVLTGSALATHYAGSVIGRDVTHFKLLLRPLSDITEEEAKEIFKIERPADWYSITDIFLSDEGIRYKYLSAPSIISNCKVYYDMLSPKRFQYLLSKGFDLFGLIESGKAIDKTKLN